MAGSLSVGVTVAGAGRSSPAESVKSGKDLKLQRIINKFKSGKKLTSGELSYLAKAAPDIYQKVLRIMQRREQLEKRLEEASSKEEVQAIMMQEMQSVENFCANSDDDFEKTALVNQMMDAYGKMTQSASYREKPDTEFSVEEEFMMEDKTEKEKRKKNKNNNSSEHTSDDNGQDSVWDSIFGNGQDSIWDGVYNNGQTDMADSLPEWMQSGNTGEATMTEPGDFFPEGEGTAAVDTGGSFVDNRSFGTAGSDTAATGTFEAVTYTSKGTKKRAYGSSGQTGAKVNVAI